MPASAGLLVSLLAVAFFLVPLTPVSAAAPSGLHQSVTTQAMNSAPSAALQMELSHWFGAEGNPIRFPRPRVMAIIGIGLLAVGVFLRRREGNGI
jgi:hypothetical protein